jgi:hypothetical protein
MQRAVRFFAGVLAACIVCVGTARAAAVAADVPFHLIDNRVFIPVTLNGKGPFQMLLDTGADTGGISLETMRAIAAPAGGRERIGGAGEGMDAVIKTRIASLQIGNATFRDLRVMAERFGALNDVIGFRSFDGILGQAVFRRYVAEIDFAASRVRLIEPKTFHAPSGATGVPFTFYQSFMPLVRGSIAGMRGRFIVDLGDRSSLTLFGPFWRARRLNEKLQPGIEALTGYGVGGPIRGIVVRVPSFGFGKAMARGIVARLSLQKSGGFADPHIAGSIGTGVLRHFHVYVDYSRRMFWLEPTEHVADRFDRAGLWLGRHGNQFEVFDVIAGGPADAAGLRKGDVVVAIDRRPTNTLDLFKIREQLRDPSVDDPLLFDYLRGGRHRQATVILRDLLPGG